MCFRNISWLCKTRENSTESETLIKYINTSKLINSLVALDGLRLFLCVLWSLLLSQKVPLLDLNETQRSSRVMEAPLTQMNLKEESLGDLHFWSHFWMWEAKCSSRWRDVYYVWGWECPCRPWPSMAQILLSRVINSSHHCWQAWAVVQLV